MVKNIFAEIKAEYKYLSRIEKSIADLILNEPKQFVTYSMAQVSQLAGVSQGSINNFAKKFSDGGFSALKLKTATCLSAHDEVPFSVVDKNDSVMAALELKTEETVSAFRNTLEINDERTLKNVVDKILNAKKIDIYGVFTSGIVAKEFGYQLIQLGIPANFVEDTLMCAVSATMLDADCLVIAVSSTGRTKEIIDAVEIARKNDVPIISVTGNKFSPLAKISDEVLVSPPSGASVSGSAAEIRMSQLLLLDAISSVLRSVIDVGGKEHYYKLKDVISSHSVRD